MRKIIFQMMADYWQSPGALKNDPVVAGKMNALAKIVISKTYDKAEWKETRLIKENTAAEIS